MRYLEVSVDKRGDAGTKREPLERNNQRITHSYKEATKLQRGGTTMRNKRSE
ncbi:hypothetical protein [Vibrio mediterranei]|uniref:hypothetical protein n=1 Tax=Vibrio mediterranei TaxID=689 RepID=UPI0013DD8E34|nr:hypothetical protein [Vibrio mediterranei]MCG9790757.1 hypothetical protein [Vibrio mediterranei]